MNIAAIFDDKTKDAARELLLYMQHHSIEVESCCDDAIQLMDGEMGVEEFWSGIDRGLASRMAALFGAVNEAMSNPRVIRQVVSQFMGG